MSSTTVKMPGTPPRWVNAGLATLVRVPVLGSLMGRSIAVITVTGASTGARYSTPVQYVEVDGHLLVTSQVTRRWWRNLRTRPEVTIERGRGQERRRATVAGGDAARGPLAELLGEDRRLARFYRVRTGPDGAPEPDDLDALVERLVVIDLAPPASG